MATTAKEILIGARALIEDPEHWTKYDTGYEGSRRGVMCAGVALERFVTRTLPDEIAGNERSAALNTARSLLADATRDGVIAGTVDAVGRIIAWNDDPETTHADVLAAYDKAIQEAN